MSTTWNPSDNSDATLSNGNLTATFQTTVSTWQGIRGTTSHSSGKYYFECTCSAIDGAGGWLIGVADSTKSLTSGYLGSDGHGASFELLTGGQYNWYSNGGTKSSPNSGAVLNHVIACAVDIGGLLIWWNDLTASTGWTDSSGGGAFTGNPGSGIGGYSMPSISTPIFICAVGDYNSSNADGFILNPGPSGLTGMPPSGFLAWDSSGAAVTPTRTLMGVGSSLQLLAPYFVADRLVRNRVITRRNLWKPLTW